MSEQRASAGESDAAVRVGLIGYGLAGSAFHAPLIAANSGMRLAAVVTADPERSASARRDHPDALVVPSADALWERAAELDLVVVATPNRTHVPLALAALEVGLPVVVDKPFAATAADAMRVVEAARQRGLLLTVYQNRRWDGDFLTLRALLDEGRLGPVVRFESRFERWRPVPKGGWRESGAPEEAGGILYDLGSHLVDQALVLFGPVARVYAEVDRRRPGVEVDDDAFLALTHPSGVRSHLWMSAVAAQGGPRFRVLGGAGAYVKHGTDVQEARLRAGGSPREAGWGVEPEESWGMLGAGDELRTVPSRPGAYQDFYQGVRRALRDGGPAPVDPLDAVSGLRIIEAARASAEQGRVVELDDE
jgi:predicted dehydrogenase